MTTTATDHHDTTTTTKGQTTMTTTTAPYVLPALDPTTTDDDAATARRDARRAKRAAQTLTTATARTLARQTGGDALTADAMADALADALAAGHTLADAMRMARGQTAGKRANLARTAHRKASAEATAATGDAVVREDTPDAMGRLLAIRAAEDGGGTGAMRADLAATVADAMRSTAARGTDDERTADALAGSLATTGADERTAARHREAVAVVGFLLNAWAGRTLTAPRGRSATGAGMVDAIRVAVDAWGDRWQVSTRARVHLVATAAAILADGPLSKSDHDPNTCGLVECGRCTRNTRRGVAVRDTGTVGLLTTARERNGRTSHRPAPGMRPANREATTTLAPVGGTGRKYAGSERIIRESSLLRLLDFTAHRRAAGVGGGSADVRPEAPASVVASLLAMVSTDGIGETVALAEHRTGARVVASDECDTWARETLAADECDAWAAWAVAMADRWQTGGTLAARAAGHRIDAHRSADAMRAAARKWQTEAADHRREARRAERASTAAAVYVTGSVRTATTAETLADAAGWATARRERDDLARRSLPVHLAHRRYVADENPRAAATIAASAFRTWSGHQMADRIG